VPDVLFRFDVDASPDTLLRAVKTAEGIRSFWTTRAEVPADVGETLTLEFQQAPKPFDLRLEQSDDRTVVWRAQTFPPHWVGTTIRWESRRATTARPSPSATRASRTTTRPAASPTRGARSWPV
jgi:hypothetical protein